MVLFLSAQLFEPNVVTIKLSVVMMQNTFNCHNKRPVSGHTLTHPTHTACRERDAISLSRWGHSTATTTTQKACV